MSHLTDKSKTLSSAATLLHENMLYPAVAHSAYYSCYQLMMHIWLHSMKKKVWELGLTRQGAHNALANGVAGYIKQSGKKKSVNESREFSRKILKLKKLRTNADYSDTEFGHPESERSIALSKALTVMLKNYYTL
jgi:uncharacterized protein (UPF0332 family)